MTSIRRAARGRIAELRNPTSLGAKLALILILIGIGLIGSVALTALLASVIDGHAGASAAFTASRDVAALGQRMVLMAAAGSSLVLLTALLLLWRIMTRLVLRPLARIASHLEVVRVSGSLAPLPHDARRDEIGALGTGLNAMLEHVQDLREQIEVQSFARRKSEGAVAVMHNVRNALNPISTIISQGIGQHSPVDRAVLDRALAELAQADLPAARRAKLVAFVTAAIEAAANDRTVRQAQLQVGRDAVGHVLEIIGAQQSAAHEPPELVPCEVTEILARNATIARYSSSVSITFSFPPQPCAVMASRVILSQVIGNLFSNAADAIAARGLSRGMISVMIERDRGVARIAIRDDGEGFAGDHTPDLFQHGFSTRDHKSGGLGLHWCANAMVAMRGSLTLESEGPGRGAVARLTLRLAETANRIAA